MVQVNVVVPAPTAELVRRVGRGLREVDDFDASLGRFLDSEAGISIELRQTLVQQIAEAVVSALTPIVTRQEAVLAAAIALADGSLQQRKRSPPSRGQLLMDL